MLVGDRLSLPTPLQGDLLHPPNLLGLIADHDSILQAAWPKNNPWELHRQTSSPETGVLFHWPSLLVNTTPEPSLRRKYQDVRRGQ